MSLTRTGVQRGSLEERTSNPSPCRTQLQLDKTLHMEGRKRGGELGPRQKDCLSQNLGETKRVLLRKALESRARERGPGTTPCAP